MCLCPLYIDVNLGPLCEGIDLHKSICGELSTPTVGHLRTSLVRLQGHTVGKHKLHEALCQGAH